MRESQTNLGWDVLLDMAAHRGTRSERLTAAIRSAIRDGRLPQHTALPPSRALADELGLSRWAVTRAYGQLVAECYLTARTGSATRVAWAPESTGRAPAPAPAAQPMAYDMMPFRSDLREFPRRRWIQALTDAAQSASFSELDTPEPGGVWRLRTVLSAYLDRVRGAATEPDSVNICFGAGQGMLRICMALSAAGHTAIAVEEPGPTRLWQAAALAGLQLVPLPVDADGIVVERLDDHPGVRAVCVGAAHQCPLGYVLAPHRRSALLEWARRVDGLIVEDDYDAEFRYDRPAVAAMQGMAPNRVALIGSVSKSLGPAVGIGWAVTPPYLAARLRNDDELALMPTSLNQLALASMLESGAYDRHLRAARARFRARRDALLAALASLDGCTVRGAEAGLHVILDLPPGLESKPVKLAARRRGVSQTDLDAFRTRPDLSQPALVLGYGNLADHAVGDAVRILGEVIAKAR
jgi:GntR family transcriptional regulator/MocR family aminotransferase